MINRNNYLSRTYQLEAINKFHEHVSAILQSYIDRRGSSSIRKDMTLQEAKTILNAGRSIAKEQLVQALLNARTKATEIVNDHIVRENCHDNRYLLEYFKLASSHLSFVLNLFTNLEKGKSSLRKSKLPSELEKLISCCEERQKYFQRAVNIAIYKVQTPRDEYQHFITKSSIFYYLNRATASAKGVAGGLTAVAGVGLTAATLITPIGWAAIFATDGNWLRVPLGLVGLGAETVVETASQFGRSIKINIPREWISGIVGADLATLVQENSKYFDVKLNEEGRSHTVYMLDAKDPQDVFERGSNYVDLGDGSPLNPHGHVIFFQNIESALECAVLRADGALYDPVAGWREHNTWKEHELQKLVGTDLRNTIADTAGLPEVAAAIVVEYVSGIHCAGLFASSRSDMPPATPGGVSTAITTTRSPVASGAQLSAVHSNARSGSATATTTTTTSTSTSAVEATASTSNPGSSASALTR